MDNFVVSLTNAIENLTRYPDKTFETSEIIKELLNRRYEGVLYCHMVYITKGNGSDPFVASVIPRTAVYDNILDLKGFNEYDVDIDVSSFLTEYNPDGLTPLEVVAWLLHELAANIITDDTLLRFKKMIVKLYAGNGEHIMNKTLKSSMGWILWISMFSRTRKSEPAVDNVVAEFGDEVLAAWKDGLSRYIRMCGGNLKIMTDAYVDAMDKTSFRQFNQLARRYTSDMVRYNDTRWSTFTKYLLNTTKSELFKNYVQTEPKKVALYADKDIFTIYNDNILREDAADFEPKVGPSSKELLTKAENLAMEVKSIESGADKILAAAKANDLAIDISDKMSSSDPLTQSSDIVLLTARDEVDKIKEDIINTDTSCEISVKEIAV